MEEEKVNPFYKMPKSVWDILVAIMLVIAIACVICECVFYFYVIKKPIKLGIGIVGIISAFFMVLLLIYSYLPGVKKVWDEGKVQAMLQDPANAELIAKYTSSKDSKDVEIKDEDEIETYEEMEDDEEENL